MEMLVEGVRSNKNVNQVGLQLNTSIQSIDLSDNDLTDQHAITLCNFVKLQCETRDAALWEVSLRQSDAEETLRR